MAWRDAWKRALERWANPAVLIKPPTDLNEWPTVDGPSSQSLRDRKQLVDYLMAKNPRRWARMQRDFTWARREMKKLGKNPEDVRFLL